MSFSKFLDHVDEDKARRRKIAFVVVICHVVIIGGPLLWYFITEWLKPEKPKTMQVRLVSAPSSSGGQPSFTPTPPKPDRPKTRKNPKIKISKKIIKKKTTKPKIKISKKVVKKKPTKTTKPKIKKSSKVIKKSKVIRKSPPRKTRKQLEDELRKSFKSRGLVGTPQPGIEANKATFEQLVGAYIRPRWNQPSRHDLRGRQPRVYIKIRVSATGNVISAKITRSSGIAIMDRSVQKLLNSLRTLPRPPRGITTAELIMVVEDI